MQPFISNSRCRIEADKTFVQGNEFYQHPVTANDIARFVSNKKNAATYTTAGDASGVTMEVYNASG